ncbi:MAG TPA: hypothetical protein VG095_10235 [Chthoniobacterales bacterium]|nr:hypothetical protein [Chthoniobacterales bacterium]
MEAPPQQSPPPVPPSTTAPAATPPPLPQPVVPPPATSGWSCFAAGCMSLIAVGVLGLLLLLGGVWFLYVKAVDTFTSEHAVDIAATAVSSESDFASADAKLTELNDAIYNEQSATIAFTAPELNALIARHPNFAEHRGRMLIELNEAIATVQMSVPLQNTKLPRLRGRWFNGTARFGFSYENGSFEFDPDWLEASGHRMSGKFLRNLGDVFSESFTEAFDEAAQEQGTSEFWKQVRSIRLERGQLIITTRGEARSV